MDYTALPRETHLSLAEVSTSNKRGREHKGITTLSPQTIRRMEKRGLFPASRAYIGARGRYYILGEILDWLDQQNANVT